VNWRESYAIIVSTCVYIDTNQNMSQNNLVFRSMDRKQKREHYITPECLTVQLS